jgi:hypothetical protein
MTLKKIEKYMTEFKIYVPYYSHFLGLIGAIIDDDLELKAEWEKLVKQREISIKDYEKRIEEEYLNKTGLVLDDREKPNSIDNTYDNTKAVTKRYNDVVMDNGIIEVGNELVRIYHTTDKEIIRCGPFHLYELPQEAIERLRKEGKIRPLS